MTGLTQRVITAIIFAVVMIAGIFTSKLTFGILFLVITALCLWEFFTLILKGSKTRKTRRIMGVGLGILPYLEVFLSDMNWIDTPSPLVQLTVLTNLLFLYIIYELIRLSDQPIRHIGAMMTGFIYIGLPYAMLYYIGAQFDGFQPTIIFGMLLLTWTNDTAAYFAGSNFGKHKLFPQVSPKKTWEGSIGGAVGTIIMGAVLSFIFPVLSLNTWLAIAAAVTIFGSIGDLVESMLKRSVGAKDSGTLLPGHGGFLDRFDAFLFLIPFVLMVLLVFGK